MIVTGAGEPCTVVVHGLAASVAATRPFASGVPGRRAFPLLPGHDGVPVPPGFVWSHDALAAVVDAAAARVGASAALGVSLGAAAVAALLAGSPNRFDRAVFVLPAGSTAPPATEGPPFAGTGTGAGEGAMAGHLPFAEALESGDAATLTRLLLAGQPAAVRDRPGTLAWVERETRRLLTAPMNAGVAGAIRGLAGQVVLADPARLAAHSRPVLVIGQEDDPVHPSDAARALAALFPDARLEVFPGGGLLHAHRAAYRALLADFFAGSR